MRKSILGAIIATTLLVPAAASAKWAEASSAHFVVYADTSPDKLKRYAETLERYDAMLRLLSGAGNPPVGRASRVTVFLVSDLATLRRVFGGRTTSVAGFYIPRAGGSVAFAPIKDNGGGVNSADVLSSQSIVLHEYAHHFMSFNTPGSYPGWYREGFAEFAGATTFGSDGSVSIGGGAMHRRWGLAGGAVKIADMVQRDLDLKPIEQDEFYARGWQLTHYLTFAPERKGQLDTYLRAIASGTPRAKAATEAFGDLGKLERDTRSYMSGRNIPGIRLAAAAVPIGAVAIRELSDAEAAALPVKIASQRGVDDAQAEALLPQARALGARYPTNPFVQGTVAEAEIDAHHYPQAIAAADRALAAKPNDAVVMVIRGRALMEQARAAKATDEATWKEVRRWFVTANRADQRDPDPLIQNYYSYGAAGQRPSANAVVGLIEAGRLAPQDGGLRIMVMRELLAKGDIAAARRQFTMIAADAHGRGGSRFAGVWTAFDAGDAKAALNAFDAAVMAPQ